MPQNFVLELQVKNGSAIRGDYVFWEGSVYQVADLDSSAKTLEIRPFGKNKSQLKHNLIISATTVYCIKLQNENRIFDKNGKELRVGSIVTYGSDLETRWEIVGIDPQTNEFYIYSRENLREEFNNRFMLAQTLYLQLIPSLEDKHGKLLYHDDTVHFDGADYQVRQLDTRCQILHLIQTETGRQEIVSSSAVELKSEEPFD
jgi:hypothetical protein